MSGNSSEAVDQHVAFGDLDALIAALSCAIQEEIDTSKVQNKVGCIGWYPLTSQADFGQHKMIADCSLYIHPIHDRRDLRKSNSS